MSMYDEIKSTPRQFSFEPKIENAGNFKKAAKYIVVGMGGSHLAADLLKTIKPELDVIIHSDYGLPALSAEEMKDRLVILSSYSGTTEEVLDAYERAGELGMSRAAISIGGKLLEKAKKDGTPFIHMPDLNMQPRMATILSLKSLLKFMGEESLLSELEKAGEGFDMDRFEQEGRILAEELRGYVPIIYASLSNKALAYIWKIKFNETGKIPAFYNVFPELNHNEMTGFDVREKTRQLSEKFLFIFLKDENDPMKIQERMDITKSLYDKLGFKTRQITMTGLGLFHRVFGTLSIADFAAYFIADGYGLEPEQVPLVEEFKRLIK